MNLLIAMMSDTLFKVADNSKAEYQMVFARLVKSYVTATVFPIPLNLLEHAINWKFERKASEADLVDGSLQWGKVRVIFLNTSRLHAIISLCTK